VIGDVDMVSTIAWIALLAFAFAVLVPRARPLPPATRREIDRADRARRADLTHVLEREHVNPDDPRLN
jgi:hypothetical protein